MESAATGGAAHPPGACDPPQNCGGYMSLVGHWEEAKFPAGINLVQTMAPGWRQIVSEVALDLITIPAVSALVVGGDSEERGDVRDSQCGATPPNNNKMLPCAQSFSHRIYLAFLRLHLYINISFFCVVLGLEQSMQIPHVRFYAVMRLFDLDIHYALLLSESA